MLGDIITHAADLSLVISREGRVLSVLVNPTHPGFGDLSSWEGENLRDFLTSDSQPKLERQLAAFADGRDAEKPVVELNHCDKEQWEFPIRYTFHLIGPDETVLLMMGRDLRPIAEMQMQLIEAQMALERDYEVQREYDTRYRVLLEATSEAFVLISVGAGRVVDVNPAASALIGLPREDLMGQVLAQEFEGRRQGEFLQELAASARDDTVRPLDLHLRRSELRVLVTPKAFRAAGDQLILCRVEPAIAAVGVSDDLTEGLGAMYHTGVDAIVFTDTDGIIFSANDSFLGLADAPDMSSVKGHSLADYLVRGSVDLRVLVENAIRSGQMRMFATKLAGDYGAQVSVEISVTHLADVAHPALVFVIRDASRMEVVRKPGVAVSDDAVRSVMELVGTASLKDIVAETTDVVEKMCIETAVELTRNNRVAAAEMLGLSRQSLYVKLRKYGLLNRNAAAD
nr:transcriptional regulator PpsR [Rhodovulum imhoffii]